MAAPIHHLATPPTVGAMLDRLGPVVFVADESEMPTGPPVESAPEIDPASVAVALGTSGSTGTPKVALHSHRGLLHKARVMTAVHDLGPGNTILLPGRWPTSPGC